MSGLLTGGRNGWGDEGDRPGRFGLFFIGIWTLFLIQPLKAGWDERGAVSGWVGMIGTLVFAVVYLTIFARRRIALRGGAPHAELVPGLVAVGLASAIAVVVCVAVGQPGTATAVYLCVLCAMTLPSLVVAARRPWRSRRSSTPRASSWRAGSPTPACC